MSHPVIDQSHEHNGNADSKIIDSLSELGAQKGRVLETFQTDRYGIGEQEEEARKIKHFIVADHNCLLWISAIPRRKR